MEIRDIHKHSGWYSLYMKENQGIALVECQAKKIKQLSKLLEKIEGEIELAEDPKEYDEKNNFTINQNINKSIEEVEASYGNYKWIG